MAGRVPPSAAVWLALGAAAPGPAHGAPPDGERTVGVYRLDTAWNRHRRGGADNRRMDGLVIVIREPGGAARVIESGAARDFSMTMTERGNRHRVERRRWQRAWIGTWRGERMTLSRAADDCAVEVQWNQEPVTREACRATPPTLDLRCTPWQGEGAVGHASGWICHPTDGPGPETLPWVVADRCVTGGRDPVGRVRFRACPPDPGPPMP